MGESKRTKATYQDVLDAPPHKVAEIIGGELRVSPRPALAHQSVATTLGAELVLPFGRGRGGPGGWIIMAEPELHFGDDVLVPDLAGWRRERLPQVDDAFVTLPPDWLCEVLSRSTEKIDRAEKLPIYAAVGVRHVWLISPRLRTLEVLRLHEGNWLNAAVYKDDDRVRAEPFEAIELELASLWADLPPPLRAGEPSLEYAI
ncbi:MAG: hypothetical protein JWO36_3829 [Myxococcales bacterium]|nr:hypothetical protein [Myxococcales bacterium]